MSVTEERRRIAARIDLRIRQLDASGLREIEILAEMADYMPDFHQLMLGTSGVEIDALCEEFIGFYRFAKILETLASGIASDKTEVPGGRIVNETDRRAARIDQRVHQLEAQGITGAALLEHMMGYILDLQQLWSTQSDESLISLCRRYPCLYRYGMQMEEAAEAENKKATISYGDLPELPNSVKAKVLQLLTNGATIERGYQTILDAWGQRDMWVETEIMKDLQQQWKTQFAGLDGELRAANVPDKSCVILMRIFEPMAQRIDLLFEKVALLNY